MVRESGVESGRLVFGHVAGDAIGVRDGTGAARMIGRFFCAPEKVASKTYCVIRGRVGHQAPVRVMARKAGDSRVPLHPAAAILKPIRRETNVQHSQGYSATLDHVLPGSMARPAEIDRLRRVEPRYARMAEDLLAELAAEGYKEKPFDSHPPTFYNIVPADSAATTEVSAVLNGATAAANAFDRVVSSCVALRPRLPRRGQAFFGDDLCLQAEFMLDSNLLIEALDQATNSLGRNDATGVMQYLEQAKHALEKAQASLDERAQGLVFAGWYAVENKFGVQNLLKALDG
jgi:hypothetical protein